MCGIVAVWDPALAPAELLRELNTLARRIEHRGPDGSGSWRAPGEPLGLAHRRLAIRGLGPTGDQPMVGPLGTLVFNGELFGIEPLRSELEGRGHRFRGTSDTELLHAALSFFPFESTLERIHGQFAFAYWSIAERRLFFARDRVGIRPLYFAASRTRFALASEQKALIPLPWVDTTPNRGAALRFLATARTDDIPFQTFLEGVQSLPAAHWGTWDGTDLTISRYHRIDDNPVASTVADVRRELDRAVEEQLVSEVPIGATISGGLDSSTVALLADQIRQQRGDDSLLHLFAYHDEAAEADEREYQKAALASFRSPHEVHWISSTPEQLRSRFETYVHHQEEPYGDISSYAEFCIAESAASHGVKVLLNGLGGDEVFAGYPAFLGPLVLDGIRAGRFEEVGTLLAVTPSILGGGSPRHSLVAAAYHALPSRFRNLVSSLRSSRSNRLPRSTWRSVAFDAIKNWHPHDGCGWANPALRGSIESWCIPRYLAHSDRMNLAHSVEGRVPLLDDGVIRSAFGLPAPERVGPWGLKEGLRRAAADVLPKLIRERAWKLGFHAPVGAYVRALAEPLHAGHTTARDRLDNAPAWETLTPAQQWLWGSVGVYFRWVENQRSAGE